MKLEIGKRYVRRDGEVTGPLGKHVNRDYPFIDPTTGNTYAKNGEFDLTNEDEDCSFDLVSEYQEPKLIDLTKPPASYEEAFEQSEIKAMEATKDEEIIQQGGMKFETGAVRSSDKAGVMYHLISPIGLRRIAETYKEGFDKYGAYNWERGFPIGDVLNHAIAHIFSYLEGKPTGEDDLAHAAWNLLAAMHMEETHPHLDHQLRSDHPINKEILGTMPKAAKPRPVKESIETCTVDELLNTFTSLQSTKGRQQLKLGTKFTHLPTNRVFILQAITDPKTLKPTRYLWCEDTEHQHFNIDPKEWRLA